MSPFVNVQRQLLTLGLMGALLFGACSAPERQTVGVGLGGSSPLPAGSPCQSRQARPCSITLAERDGVLECFHGTQQCIGGRWGECENGTLSEQLALASPPGLTPQALSDSATCENNPCNPLCRWFDEVPEPPLSADGATGSGHEWTTGSLADLPHSVVETALHQPCRTGADCQFNTRCENPAAGSCAHTVCESGVALAAECSECAQLVYEVAQTHPDAYGQCFGTATSPTAEQCVHDPCATGVSLKQSCDAGVAEVCASQEFASCCTGSWGAACVERYRTLFPGVCQCATGEVARNGECLFYNAASHSWLGARDVCRSRGDGWDLASVSDANESAYLFDRWGRDSGGAQSAFWIGLTDLGSEGVWAWSAGSPSGVWDEASASGLYTNWCGADGSGAAVECPGGGSEPSEGSAASCASIGVGSGWESQHCSNEFLPSVCKGPPLHSDSGTEDSGTEQACSSAEEYVERWAFYQNYTGFQQHTFEPGEYVITVVARGEYAQGAWPEMELGVDFETVGTAVINDADWKSYTFQYTATSAERLPIMITFVNAESGRMFQTNSIKVECAGAGPGSQAWGSECIGVAETTCDISCNAEQPASGACVPWLPGETDPSCPDRADLSLGVPCAGSILVCNHGQVAAPQGVEVVHFPESAAQFGVASPDLGGSDVITCTTSQPVPPGDCISLPSDACVDQDGAPAPLSGTRHLMVNPQGAEAISECSGLDNWAIHVDGVACGEPACFGGSAAATRIRRPVDIIFVIDNSGSMEEEIGQVEQRINEDFADIIEQSGLDYRVIMVSRYGDLDHPFGGGGGTNYPICIRSPLGGTECLDPDNEAPVPGQRFLHYSARVGSNDALCLLLDGFSAPDELAVQNRPNWQVQAPNGFGAWLRPEAFKTFVVITDDNVDCSTSANLHFDDNESVAGGVDVGSSFDAALRALSSSHFEDELGQRKYIWHSIINIRQSDSQSGAWPPDAPIDTDLCSGESGPYVGPGTGYQALSRLTGGLRYPSCRAEDFDAVFNAIAEEVIGVSAASCTFDVQTSGVDLNQAKVSYRSASDEQVAVAQVPDAASCNSGGWYLEPPQSLGAAPTVSLCPSTCAAVQQDVGAQLFVEFGCEVEFASTTHTETYLADCEPGFIPEWTALGYDTTIEGEGAVEFYVRTGSSSEELAEAPYLAVNTATESAPDCFYLEPMACTPEDADCNCVETAGEPGGVAGGVPLNTETLDRVSRARDYLQLQITIVPDPEGISAPVLEDWKVAYSCLPGE